MGVLGIKDIAKRLNVSYKEATRIVNLPGCPVLPRSKWQTFRIPEEAFEAWWKAGCPE